METAYIAIGAALVYAACAAAAVGAFLPVLPGAAAFVRGDIGIQARSSGFAARVVERRHMRGARGFRAGRGYIHVVDGRQEIRGYMARGARRVCRGFRRNLPAAAGAVDFYRAIGRGVPRRMARGIGFARFGQGGAGAFAGSLAASMLKFLIVVYMAFAFSAGVFGLF